MIGLDSNVLVRLAVRDDEDQYRKAESFVAASISSETPAYVNLIVLVEFAWTLRRLYKYSKAEVLAAILKLLNSTNVALERQDTVAFTLVYCQRTGNDFPDSLIAFINREDGCNSTFTFDGEFARSGLAQLVR
jgi:predicted nucleic-acid-binding protein